MARNEAECHTLRIDFICAPAHISMHFILVQVGVKLYYTTGSDRYNKLHAGEIMPRNKTRWQTPRMDFICTLPHFVKPFESVQVGVILSSTTGSHGSYKHYADEFVPRTETGSLTPRMDLICALAHFGMPLESIQVSVKVPTATGSDRYYNSKRTLCRDEMKLIALHLKGTLYTPYLISPFILNPSE